MIRTLTRVQLGVDTVTARLDTNEPDALVPDEIVERSNSITSTSDTRHHGVGQLALLFRQLRLDLSSNDSLEIADNGRERVRANCRSDQVMRVVEPRHPLAHRLIDGVLERLRARRHGNDLDEITSGQVQTQSRAPGVGTYITTQHPDTEHVELLPSHVLGAHVNVALHAKLGTDSSSGHTVLSGTRLGNDALLAQSLGEQNLADGIVDLVRPRVVQVLSPGRYESANATPRTS